MTKTNLQQALNRQDIEHDVTGETPVDDDGPPLRLHVWRTSVSGYIDTEVGRIHFVSGPGGWALKQNLHNVASPEGVAHNLYLDGEQKEVA